MILSLLIGAAALACPAEPAGAETCFLLSESIREALGEASGETMPLDLYGDYRPACPWDTLGVAIGRGVGSPRRGIALHSPRIRGTRATVDFTAITAPRTGGGWRCTFDRKNNQWIFAGCEQPRVL